MMSKKLFFIPAIITMALFVFVSCSDDDDFPAPIISDLEIGYENSKVGYRGHDLHIDADILAEGRIDRIVLEIHHEEEHAHKSGQDEDHEWEFVHSWTEFNGQKNASFHKHIDIPLDAELGSYHFHFKVIDLQGKVTEIETAFEVKNPENTEAPVIVVTAAPADGEVFHPGESISISGNATHEMGLGGIYIGLVRVNQNLEDAEVNASNTITLLHTHDFDSSTAHAFNATIVVGAEEDNNITPKPIEGDIAWEEGNYYILVKSKDGFGGPWGFSQKYPVDIHMHD